MNTSASRIFIFTIAFSALLSFNSSAQTFTPFGEFSNEEASITECSFDKDADAIVLLDEASSNYSETYELVTKHHVRVKILKEKGKSNANVAIRFWRKEDFEYIKVGEAATYNSVNDGPYTATRVEKKSIFTKNLNERMGQVVFSFPDVKIGSILEYEYESVMKHYGGLEDWYFQEERPVLVSRYNLIIVPNAEFAYQIFKRSSAVATINPKSPAGGIFFEMKNVPGLRYEPYMDSQRDYLQKVLFQLSSYGRGNGFGGSKYMNSWDEVARDLKQSDGFGNMVGKKIPGTDEFIASVKTVAGEKEKMKLVYDYVRKNMSWNGIYSKFVSDGLKNAWQKKSGTVAEINFILINLLKEAGLEVYPLLASERWHGRVNTDYPFIDQFSSVIAYVKIAGMAYYLDAKEKYNSVLLTPNRLLNTKGFVADKKTGGLIDIKNDSLKYREFIFNDLTLKPDGSIEGSTKVLSDEYARVKKLEQYMENKKEFADDNFSDSKLPVNIVKFEVENTDNDSLAFIQQCNFTSQLGSTGDYSYIPLNLFSGFTKNPFLKDTRFSNVNFGYRRSINIITTIYLPDGFTVDELLKPVKLVNPENDIEMIRSVEYKPDEKKLLAMISITFLKSLYTVEDYDILQAFYKKMFEYLDEPVLLKKK